MATTVLLTLETDPTNADAAAMRASAEACGWRVLSVGAGATWTGMACRVPLYLDALREMDPSTLVLMSDARDVVVLRGPDEFPAAFAAYKAPIVASAECFAEGYMWYLPSRANGRPYFQVTDLSPYFAANNKPMPPPGRRRFVNGGLVAGSAADLLALWRYIQASEIDDQMALGAYMNEFPSRVALDTAAALLHTTSAGMYGGSDCATQIDDAPGLMELAGRGPFAVHVPGVNISAGQRLLYDCVRRVDPPQMRAAYNAACRYAVTEWEQFAIARGAIEGALRPPPKT